MPALEDAELARIPCQRCSREHFVYVDRATREVLAYDGSGTRVLAGETLPTAFTRLLNAPCDECQRVKDLERRLHRPSPGRALPRSQRRSPPGRGQRPLLRPNSPEKSPGFRSAASRSRPTPAAFHTPTSETPAASRRSSRLGSSVPAYSGGSDAAIADGVDARNVLPLPPIGSEARLPQPGGEIEICERKARGAFQPCARARETAVPVGVRLCSDSTIRHRGNATFRRQPCVGLEVAVVRGHASIHSLPGVHRANPEVCLISPIIHRLQPDLDAQQRAVVGHLGGPLLVIAGPGAGKTRTVVWRAVNLLLQGAVDPAELALCTFSKKAAGELRQRFHAAAHEAGCSGDLSAVRVSTVHSLCRRIVSQHGKAVGYKSDFVILDEWAQLDLMNAHYHRIFGPDRDELRYRGWRTRDYTVRQGRRYIERIAEEGIDPEILADSDDPFLSAIGRCCLRYEGVLRERGALDLSHLQVAADALLQDDGIAHSVGATVRHLMVDEYQDTSCVQERVLLRLAQAHGNPCVVGDDDQSIYRFRGASVRNLLEFPERFREAAVIRLTVNYRSHPGIVRAFDRWMASADWTNPNPALRPSATKRSSRPTRPVPIPTMPQSLRCWATARGTKPASWPNCCGC